MRAVIAEFPSHWLKEWRKSEASQRDEMWEGVLHIPPMPWICQQDLQGALCAYLHYRWARPRDWEVILEINLASSIERDWQENYRIPDLTLLDPSRFSINRETHFAGAPLAVVEIHVPDDEAYEKLSFYAGLGVPEVWIIDRDTKETKVFALDTGPSYLQRSADADGWLRSPATGVEFRQTRPGKVWLRVAGDEATADELPED